MASRAAYHTTTANGGEGRVIMTAVATPPVYLDCAATTPLDPRVVGEMRRYFEDEFGNAGSRTHEWGARARAAVEHARDQVAAVIGVGRGDVVFTSGATESNNLTIFGLTGAAPGVGSVVATAIEHRAVLEPLFELKRRGGRLTLVPPEPSGAVDPARVLEAVTSDTRLVSVMHVNNETGVIQPIEAIADGLMGSTAYFHVDAAQSFARDVAGLRHPRIDLISVSAHKIGGPKGVGALIARRRGQQRPPLQPLMFGGGQERGLRPGTLPVPLLVGFGLAGELAVAEAGERKARCEAFRRELMHGLAPLDPAVNGDVQQSVPYIVNLSFPGVEAEVAIDAWRNLVAVSNGAACTTQTQSCSHVLEAMQLSGWRSDNALRFSWSAGTPQPDWPEMVRALEPFRQHTRVVR